MSKPKKPINPNRIPRGQVTLEDNTDWVRGRLEDTPERVFTHIGKVLAKEARAAVIQNTRPQYTKSGKQRKYGKSGKRKRGNYMASKLTYWARKKDKDLQIGFKDNNMSNSYNYDKVKDSLRPTVVNNKDLIWKLFYEAMDKLTKK